MAYTLHVDLHPLGVIVEDDQGERELLIEGESCCCLSFQELVRIASTTRKIVLGDGLIDPVMTNGVGCDT